MSRRRRLPAKPRSALSPLPGKQRHGAGGAQRHPQDPQKVTLPLSEPLNPTGGCPHAGHATCLHPGHPREGDTLPPTHPPPRSASPLQEVGRGPAPWFGGVGDSHRGWHPLSSVSPEKEGGHQCTLFPVAGLGVHPWVHRTSPGEGGGPRGPPWGVSRDVVAQGLSPRGWGQMARRCPQEGRTSRVPWLGRGGGTPLGAPPPPQGPTLSWVGEGGGGWRVPAASSSLRNAAGRPR